MAGITQQALAGQYDRTTGVATEQVVSSNPGILHGITVRNADAGAQTVTVLDGTTTLIVLGFAAGTSGSVTFNCEMLTDIRVTPSSTNLDICTIYS